MLLKKQEWHKNHWNFYFHGKYQCHRYGFQIRHCTFNSFPPSAASMRQWIGSAMRRIMAYRLLGAKPLSQYWDIANWTLGTKFFEIWINIQTFSFTKMPLKVSFPKWRPFCPGEMGYLSRDGPSLDGTRPSPRHYALCKTYFPSSKSVQGVMLTCIKVRK